MKKEGYYSSGEFAKMANITKKTIRYYDEKNILKPSALSESGARFYTDQDLLHLQQILLLKFLGFSLSDIREMLLSDGDTEHLSRFLRVQQKLVEDRIGQMELVKKIIEETADILENGHEINWPGLLELIHITGMEDSMRNQYKNASNISARIDLHSMYAQNPVDWFSWIFDQLEIQEGMSLLEVGCGSGALWKDRKLPKKLSVTLSDISDGMVRDAERSLSDGAGAFHYEVCSCEELPFPDESFDQVTANHVLFYCEDIEKAISELYRVLKPGGRLIAGTYGRKHMMEISRLVEEFDERIHLNTGNLFDRFGKENGGSLLENCFRDVSWVEYPDSLLVTEAEPLISYVLSCHGNQNQYIVDAYQDFKAFVKKKTDKGFFITKEAGIFRAIKE